MAEATAVASHPTLLILSAPASKRITQYLVKRLSRPTITRAHTHALKRARIRAFASLRCVLPRLASHRLPACLPVCVSGLSETRRNWLAAGWWWWRWGRTAANASPMGRQQRRRRQWRLAQSQHHRRLLLMCVRTHARTHSMSLLPSLQCRQRGEKWAWEIWLETRTHRIEGVAHQR